MSVKYFHFLIFALIGIICLTPIMAQDEYVTLETLGITPFSNNTTVEINNISFNIPAGYGEYNASAFDNETIVIDHAIYIQSRHEFKNESLDTISIVVYFNENKSTNPIDDIYSGENTTKTVIKGYTGYWSNESGSCTFRFMKDR